MAHFRSAGVLVRWQAAGYDPDVLRGLHLRGYQAGATLHLDRSCHQLHDHASHSYLHDRSYPVLKLPAARCWRCCSERDVLAQVRVHGRPLLSWIRRSSETRRRVTHLEGCTEPGALTVAALELHALTTAAVELGPEMAAAHRLATERLAAREALLDPASLGASAAPALVVAHPGEGTTLSSYHVEGPSPAAADARLLAAWLLPQPTVRWLGQAGVARLTEAAASFGWTVSSRPCPSPAGIAVAAHWLASGLAPDEALTLAAATVS